MFPPFWLGWPPNQRCFQVRPSCSSRLGNGPTQRPSCPSLPSCPHPSPLRPGPFRPVIVFIRQPASSLPTAGVTSRPRTLPPLRTSGAGHSGAILVGQGNTRLPRVTPCRPATTHSSYPAHAATTPAARPARPGASAGHLEIEVEALHVGQGAADHGLSRIVDTVRTARHAPDQAQSAPRNP
jgi:hypothetical protein